MLSYLVDQHRVSDEQSVLLVLVLPAVFVDEVSEA